MSLSESASDLARQLLSTTRAADRYAHSAGPDLSEHTATPNSYVQQPPGMTTFAPMSDFQGLETLRHYVFRCASDSQDGGGKLRGRHRESIRPARSPAELIAKAINNEVTKLLSYYY